MRLHLVILLALAPSVAGAFQLVWPVDCVPGETCFIQNYVDRDPGDGAEDYTCGSLTYDGHRGTDIRVGTEKSLQTAAPQVFAAADGTVQAIRDEMPDSFINSPGALPIEQIRGRECGNGVVIAHEGGWQTQYCHMARGSILVSPGDRVAAGTPLGDMGASGATEFPHLHFSVEQNGRTVDPFSPQATAECRPSPTPDTPWLQPPNYVSGRFLDAGNLDRIPDYAEIQRGLAPRLRAGTKEAALVLWAFGFGSQAEDAISFRLDGPNGNIFDRTVLLERTQAQMYRAFGRRTPPDGWEVGTYNAKIEWRRGGAVIDSREFEFVLEAR